MGKWVIVAVLVSLLATAWLAWLLHRINTPPEARRRGNGADAAVPPLAGGSGRDRDADGQDGGSDGGGGDGGGD